MIHLCWTGHTAEFEVDGRSVIVSNVPNKPGQFVLSGVHLHYGAVLGSPYNPEVLCVKPLVVSDVLLKHVCWADRLAWWWTLWPPAIATRARSAASVCGMVCCHQVRQVIPGRRLYLCQREILDKWLTCITCSSVAVKELKIKLVFHFVYS